LNLAALSGYLRGSLKEQFRHGGSKTKNFAVTAQHAAFA
jgi:hypothetical protein